jgi:hypothetical protein
LRFPIRRRSALVVALLGATLVLSLLGPAVSAARAPAGLSRFMYAVGQVESGGNYKARNKVSGAYGKYQIMPSNWPSWARTYLGHSNARQTPRNQEKVAAGKFTSLHRSLDSWRRVAYWWLTGSKRTSGWSAYATRYVNRVMRLYKSGAPSGPTIRARHIGERNAAIDYTGRWRTARHGAYAGDAVRYATASGASATVTFTGRRIIWIGPVGPTRGKARVYVDGRYRKTVDLRSGVFDARDTLFKASWRTAGTHTLTIRVIGTRGRPMVAIDEFLVSK